MLSLRVRSPNSLYIANDVNGCCPNMLVSYKDKTMFSADLGFNPFDKSNDSSVSNKKFVSLREKFLKSFGIKHIFCYNGGGACLNLSHQQTRLLKTVVEYLNQASTALYFSNNRFLSSAAKDLAAQLGDQFCVG